MYTFPRVVMLMPVMLALSCTQVPRLGDQITGGAGSALAEPTVFLPDDTLVPPPALGDGALLNELRYRVAEGESQFVELKGVSPTALANGLSLRNDAGEVYAIPAALVPADANGIVTIYFDSQNLIAADVVHADRGALLNAESGSLQLLDQAGNILDAVAWGLDRVDSVRLSNGGIVDQLLPQATIGRPPSSVTPSSSGQWVTFDAPLATPGRPNRNLCVTVLLPTHGALVETGERILSWYPVEGAAHYRVQVAGDSAPDILLVDQVVDDPLFAFTVAAGQYTWRVQAMMADGSLADFSTTSQFQVVDSFDAFFEQQDAPGAKALGRNAKSSSLTRRVPLYAQRKDTYMLHPKSNQEDGDHAWNAPHALDTSRWGDPADNCNCAPASISMINGFFAQAGGSTPHLSQDRIEVAARTHIAAPGISPNHDLNYGEGLDPSKIIAGMDFALGVKPALKHVHDYLKPDISLLWGQPLAYPQEFRNLFFADLKISIAADQPVLIGVWQQGFPAGHAMVATHYAETPKDRWVGVNDPWYPEFRWQQLSKLPVGHYYILPPGGATPRADTPEYLSSPSKANGNDDDEDGVSNFDEIIRFGTDPKKKDTDDDCVNDLEEIRSSVFDREHGWGTYYTAIALKQTPESDGQARRDRQPELTPDSDGGGLPDFVEDLNQNGQIEPDKGESDPFDPSDDARKITGTYRNFLDRVEPGFHSERFTDLVFDLSTEDRKITGTVKATWNSNWTQEVPADPPECPSPRTTTATYDTVERTLQADVEFLCSPDALGPVMIIREREPIYQFSQQVSYFDPCRGPSRSLPTPATYVLFFSRSVSATPDQFFTGPNRHVQYKARVPGSSLPHEAASYDEWDIVMEPQ